MDMQQPLISVIVPIYNVGKYVRKCLDSLVHQTMKQIEVICIDDGSTDGSGKIADEYVSDEFPIFRVIHTENRGLSAARNRGIEESCAEWLMFVDSDDWVSQDFCRVPYEAAIRENADLVVFRAYRVTRFGRIKKPKKIDAPTGIVDEMTAHEYGDVVVWNKMYRASLFEIIRFPEGHVFEDLAITHIIIHLAVRTLRLQDCLYYHLYRKNSISHVHSKAQSKDKFITILKRCNDLKEWGYPEEKLMPRISLASLGFLAYTPYSKDELHKKAEEIIESIDEVPKEYPLLKRMALMAWKKDKRLFFFSSKLISIIKR